MSQAEYQRAYRAKKFVKEKLHYLKDKSDALNKLYFKLNTLWRQNQTLSQELIQKEKDLLQKEKELDSFARELRIKQYTLDTQNSTNVDYLKQIYELKQQAKKIVIENKEESELNE